MPVKLLGYVLISITGRQFLPRLQKMEDWLGEWSIPYQVVPPIIEDCVLMIRFQNERFAHAFIAVHMEEDAKVPQTSQ
ncbi:hypothetical protein [Bosea sp. LC85]|uniref:hypothetical protein n=1 Tax=Bosea sp. LC85 TaxID=1502851 RepID=UPI0005B99AAD|nr:hypothetical protein [Bosea sp. LC85]